MGGNRFDGNDIRFQTRKVDQCADEKLESLRLIGNLPDNVPVLWGHGLFFRQNLSVKKNIGNGRFGLMGDIGDQCLNLVPFFGEISLR